MIPATEWQRIKESLVQRQSARAEQCKALQCREDRRLQSQKIVKHWENTIEVGRGCLILPASAAGSMSQGQRLKKLQARKLREEQEEGKNKEIDLQEMEFQAQCRRDAIERAKTLLYHQTDRVKTFHVSAFLMQRC